ncbi:MAG: prepilin peptidase [Alphaproteobacteria bacterium]
MSERIGLDWFLPLLAAPFIGSFLGLVIRRLEVGGAVIFARSSCPHCSHRLGARDLVPILSWALSGGRCRYCAAPIGMFYPAVEVAAILVAVWAATVLSEWLVWAGCGLGWTLLTLAAIDQRHLILPDQLTLPLVPAGLVVAYLVEPGSLIDHAGGAAAGFVALVLIAWAYKAVRGRRGLGLGDAKLLAGAGAWVSWVGLPSVVLLAAATALSVVLVRSVAWRPVALTDEVPFGPYLCLGTWLVWLYGPLIMA